jgi:hypothetical protein
VRALIAFTVALLLCTLAAAAGQIQLQNFDRGALAPSLASDSKTALF